MVRSSGTRSRRELGRRAGEVERTESAEPGRAPVPVGDSSERRDATDPERERERPAKGRELMNAAGSVKPLALFVFVFGAGVGVGVGVSGVEVEASWTGAWAGAGSEAERVTMRVAVRASGASAVEEESGRALRPSRMSRARLRSSTDTSTDARLSSLSDEEEEDPSFEDVGDATGEAVGVDWFDSEWRKIEVRRMRLDLRPLLRSHERRFFLTLVSGTGSSVASGALGDACCHEEGTVGLRSTSRDLLVTSWANC